MASEEREIKRLMIRGTVQKIGYRVWVEREALALGLKGWVRNRRDGSVEALFAGPTDNVAQMLERCKDGPRSAHVTAVKIAEEGGDAPDGFEVLPTA